MGVVEAHGVIDFFAVKSNLVSGWMEIFSLWDQVTACGIEISLLEVHGCDFFPYLVSSWARAIFLSTVGVAC